MNQRSRSRTAVAIAGAFLVPALLGGAALVLRSSGWIRSLEAQEVRRADAVVREIRDRWFQSLREGTSAEFVVDREASGAAGMPFARAPEPFVVDRERSLASDERSDPSTGALLRQLGLGYAEAGVEDLALSCFERAFAEVATSDADDERAAALDSWTTDQLLACAESFAAARRLDEAELLRRYLCEARPGEWRDLLSVPMLASLRAVEWPGTTLEVEARRARIRDEFVAGGLPIDPRTVGVIAARTGLSGALRETLEAAGRAVRTEACSEFAIGSIEGLPDGSVVLTEADRFRFVGATLVQEILDAASDSVREDLGLDALAVRVGDPRSDREEEAERVLARSTFPSLAIVATSVLPSDRIRSISLYLGLAALGSLVFGQVLVWYVVRREVALTRLKSDFVDLVSHELRTPLAALTIKTEMLAYGAVPEDKLVRYGLDIHRSALRLGALVEDVLDFARLEKGRVGPELRPQSVRALVAEGLRRKASRRCAPRVRRYGPRFRATCRRSSSIVASSCVRSATCSTTRRGTRPDDRCVSRPRAIATGRARRSGSSSRTKAPVSDRASRRCCSSRSGDARRRDRRCVDRGSGSRSCARSRVFTADASRRRTAPTGRVRASRSGCRSLVAAEEASDETSSEKTLRRRGRARAA
jgi:hypothetical protein